jgi:hypothetical protein
MEFGNLYAQVAPPGAPIPVLVEPFPVDNTYPMEEEIPAAVQHLRANKGPGPSGMRTDHLKGWLAAATKVEAPDWT